MSDADAARAILQDYFSNVGDEEYKDDTRRFSPELIEGESAEEDKTLAQLGLPGLVARRFGALR